MVDLSRSNNISSKALSRKRRVMLHSNIDNRLKKDFSNGINININGKEYIIPPHQYGHILQHYTLTYTEDAKRDMSANQDSHDFWPVYGENETNPLPFNVKKFSENSIQKQIGMKI